MRSSGVSPFLSRILHSVSLVTTTKKGQHGHLGSLQGVSDMYLRGVGPCLDQTLEDVGAQIDMLDLYREMERSGLVDAVNRVYIAFLMGENMF